jgi:hypothetical protein
VGTKRVELNQAEIDRLHTLQEKRDAVMAEYNADWRKVFDDACHRAGISDAEIAAARGETPPAEGQGH